MSKNKKDELNQETENKKIEGSSNLSNDEQLLIYADIIANCIVNEILKNNEE